MSVLQVSTNVVLLNPAKGHAQALGRQEVVIAASRGLGMGCAHYKDNSSGKGSFDLW